MIPPNKCETMAEVRSGVDALDSQIVALLGVRFQFMDAAARIKPTRDAVRDEARKAEVLENARKAAVAAGIPDNLIVHIYDTLVEGSIAYEFEKFDAHSFGSSES